MPIRITDPQERKLHVNTLEPGEAVVVTSKPPFLWIPPRDVSVNRSEDGEWLIVRRMSVHEKADVERLESLPLRRSSPMR